jgi:hypothetical protein
LSSRGLVMQIRISIEKAEPLTGTAATAGTRPLSFVGWLEMLRAVSELVGAAGGSGPSSLPPVPDAGVHRPKRAPGHVQARRSRIK